MYLHYRKRPEKGWAPTPTAVSPLKTPWLTLCTDPSHLPPPHSGPCSSQSWSKLEQWPLPKVEGPGAGPEHTRRIRISPTPEGITLTPTLPPRPTQAPHIPFRHWLRNSCSPGGGVGSFWPPQTAFYPHTSCPRFPLRGGYPLHPCSPAPQDSAPGLPFRANFSESCSRDRKGME